MSGLGAYRPSDHMNDDTMNDASLARTDLDAEDLYPIREVSRLTGVNPVTLRAWERRYGLLVPHRTASGHRLYSMADIERVRAVTAWIERGVAVSKVASIIDRQAPPPRLRSASMSSQPVEVPLVDDMSPWQERLVEAASRFDPAALDRVYGQIMASYPLPTVINGVLLPVWRSLQSHSSLNVPAQWAFLDSYLRLRLAQRVSFIREGAPTVLLAVLPGVQRELDTLVIAACLVEAGCNVGLLSTALSFPDIQMAAQKSDCAALVLFGSRALDSDVLTKRLPRLEQALECPLAMAGPASELHDRELGELSVVGLGEPGQTMIGKIRSLLVGKVSVTE